MPGAVTKLNFTPAVNIIVQGPFKGDTTARAANALARGVQAACSQYALRRLQTTQSRLDRELKEQADLSRRLDLAQTLLDKVQSDSGLSATNRLLAATVAGNTLSNIVQRQNQLDQFIGDDQSLLQQIKQRGADPDHHARQGQQGHRRRQQRIARRRDRARSA